MTSGQRRGAVTSRSRNKAPGKTADSVKQVVTKWRKLADALDQDIAAGRYAEGGQLPSEATLAAQLGVSRHTLRAAIGELVKRGTLRNVAYRGTFIAPRQLNLSIGARTRIAEALVRAGLKPGRRLLSRRLCIPPVEIAELLGVAKRAQVVEIVQILTANGLPIGYSTMWMPADRFVRVGELLEAAGSLRRAFAQVGVSNYRRKLVRITSRAAGKNERRNLKLSAGAIVIGLDGVSADDKGEPTHAFEHKFDAARIAFVLEP